MKILNWIKSKIWWNYDKNYLGMLEQLEKSAKANWESNMRPQEMKNFETYKEFFIGSHLLCFKVGAKIKGRKH